MSIRLIVSLMAFSLLGCAEMRNYRSDFRYNFQESRWETASEKDELRYNWREGVWTYAPPDAELKWNVYERKWEFANQ